MNWVAMWLGGGEQPDGTVEDNGSTLTLRSGTTFAKLRSMPLDT
ncbi:hypothetical protein [Rhodopirellula baltica]|uniref:Uncharacterized protein n=2 Tax=Rhodopirellula baltica TaxID=265606 RepID=F2AW66_RHOBT|nr:hypothetical protein [Rhodopirellula baltica]EGF26048.1 hypothetical protein RBWH47_05890 [Rhodopirellula baltica WH47]EKK02431.1 hypothetical protein RBSH_02065 [Rhodopirellula baltica SH28]